MFTWVNKQTVQSDAGFVVRFTGRFSAEYLEGTRKMSLQIADGLSGGKPCVCVRPDAFKRWDGDSADTQLSDDKQKQVKENFRAAVEFQGLALEVEMPKASASSFRR